MKSVLTTDINVSLVQYCPRWEDAAHNLARLTAMLQPLSGATDVIVLPEMFPTGFSMNVERVGRNEADGMAWMRQQAKATGAVVAGSMAATENDRCYNRFYWVTPNGDVVYYDKRHLFGMSDEGQVFAAGVKMCRFHVKGWEVCPIVCYDLRFPAWCRNTRIRPYDLLVCPASWPSVRRDVWTTLLKARALENQCYVAGVNRVGKDGNGLAHSGGSAVFGPKGEIVGQAPDDEEAAVTFRLSSEELYRFRQKFPVLHDADSITVCA
ncbi:MAG: amidohydrolase [Bacteroidales bacterium]|jgi:predicted amidohydrolase|nr:amidohydrolase [Bacteroidales bacterium]